MDVLEPRLHHGPFPDDRAYHQIKLFGVCCGGVGHFIRSHAQRLGVTRSVCLGGDKRLVSAARRLPAAEQGSVEARVAMAGGLKESGTRLAAHPVM